MQRNEKWKKSVHFDSSFIIPHFPNRTVYDILDVLAQQQHHDFN